MKLKGVFSGTTKIFYKKPDEKSVYERLKELGLTLFNSPSLPYRICRPCLRVVTRMENDSSLLRRWEKEEKDRRPPETADATSTVEARTPRTSPDDSAQAAGSGSSDKREREPTPSKTPRTLKKSRQRVVTPVKSPVHTPTTTPTRKLISKPTATMPRRRIDLEVINNVNNAYPILNKLIINHFHILLFQLLCML